jgi:hypothetical protein
VPMFLVTAITLLGMFVSALQAMTYEEFAQDPTPKFPQTPARLPRPRVTTESAGPRS